MERKIEKLRRDHPIAAFDCGSAPLNEWLHRFALGNQAAHAAETYLGLEDGVIIGFYSLVVGQVSFTDAPERLRKGLARHPVPIMLLARLAVDLRWQSRGVGRALLRDASFRTIQAAEIAGMRALVVHAKDERARAFYQRFDFLPSPTDPLHLYLLVKDLRQAAGWH
jgi:GNAT superfamily N-acetyltransferase